MKLNKIKVARLTDEQAKSVNGGGTANSTKKNFTCCWCTSDDHTFYCATTNPAEDPTCPGTINEPPSISKPNPSLTPNG